MMENDRETSQRKELKQRIVDTASQAFTTQGIRCIKMDDIAAALGISKRTLYEVFADKETLLKECVARRMAEGDELFQDVVEQSDNVLEVILTGFQMSIEVLHRTNKRFFEDIKKYPRVYGMIKERNERNYENTISFFKQGVAQGIFRTDVNFAIINLMVHEQFHVLLHTNVCNAFPLVEVYESIMFTHLRGISTEKGARMLEEFISEYRTKRRNI